MRLRDDAINVAGTFEIVPRLIIFQLQPGEINMCRISFRLFIALLTFAIGLTLSSLFNSFRAGWSETTPKSNFAYAQEPPAKAVDNEISGFCSCHQAATSGFSPTTDDGPHSMRTVSGGVLNGRAISLPAPPFPAIAKAARASGTVVVQIVINEKGCVISARAVSGHPLLMAAAVAAARQACFSPTLLRGEPVQVSGVITYNFVL
jgi:TonB family protein